jgi:glycosyltransferase involved in cell wall biosynthesis
MPEVAGDAAILFNPEDIEEIAAAMERLAAGGEERGRLVSRGLARAGEFTWQRTARLTWAAIEQTAIRGKD